MKIEKECTYPSAKQIEKICENALKANRKNIEREIRLLKDK